MTTPRGYDGFGHWITTTLPAQSSSPSRYYIYDGDLLLGELNPDGSLYKAYTWGANGPVSVYDPTAYTPSLWFVYDAQGAGRMVIDGSGNVFATATYSAYGVADAGDTLIPFGFGGQYGYFSPYHTDVFPIRCGARWYFPQLGCWLSRDPIGYSGGSNLYEYCGSDPVNYIDPLGIDRDHGVLRYVFSWDYLTDIKDEAVGAVKTVGNAVVGSMVEKVKFDAGGFHSEPWEPFHVGNSEMEQAGSVIADASLFAFSILSPFAEAPLCGAGGPCFVAGTPVAMADGTTKPIEQIQAGDAVSTRAPLTGRTEAKTVARTFRHTVYETVTVQLADAGGHIVETLTGTPEHPFFVAGGGLVAMGSLGIGTQVVTRAGPALFVASVTRRNHPQGVTVYNFEVRDDHTYFIGSANGGVWVHNDCVRPSWATPGDPRKFAAWMKNLEKAKKVLTKSEADAIVKEAKSYGMNIRALPEDLAGQHGAGNPWTGIPHIHIGDKEFHIAVPKGYTLPK